MLWRTSSASFVGASSLSAVLLSLLAVQTQKTETPFQPAPPALLLATPDAVGMDAAKLAEAVKLHRDAVERDDIRGAVLYVARRGRVVLHEAVGWRHDPQPREIRITPQPLPAHDEGIDDRLAHAG